MAMNRLKLEDVISQAKEVLEAGNPDYVIALCRYIFRYYPRALEATRVLGEAYTEKKLLDEADQLFVYVLAADPHDVLGYVDRGFIAYERSKVDEAIMYYERAIELDPNIEQLRAELLRLYKERYGSSRTKLRLTKAGLANHRMRDGFYSQAIEEYNNILSETPDRLDIQTWLMEAYWCNRDFGRAEKLAHELLEAYPYLIKANLILWHIYGVRRRQDKAGEYLEKAHALDPLNIIAERLFDNAQLMPEVRQYLDMMGLATLPAFDPTTVEAETADQPLLPLWVTADAETDRRLGLRGEEAAVSADQDPTQESDWLSKLLAETEQMVEGQPNPTQQVSKEETDSELALQQLRQGSVDDEAIGFFDEIEEQQVKVDLEASKVTKKPGDELDLNLDELAAKPAGSGEIAPFKADDQLDSLFDELAPQNDNLPLEPARFDDNEKPAPAEFKPGAFDLDLEPFDAAASKAQPQRFQFDADEEPAPFGLEGATKTNRLEGFDLGFGEEVTSPGKPDFEEEPAPFSLSNSPTEAAPSANFSETELELFDFGRTEVTSIRPDKLATFGEKETTPPPPFKLDELDFGEAEAPIAPAPVLHDEPPKAREEAPPPPFSLDEFNLDEPQFKFETPEAEEKSAQKAPSEDEEAVPVKAGPGLTGELNDFFDDPEPFGVDLFAPTMPPREFETATATEAAQQAKQGGAGEPKIPFRDEAAEPFEESQEAPETAAPGSGLEPAAFGWQEETEAALEPPGLPAELAPLSFKTEEALTQAEGSLFEPKLESLDDGSFMNFLLEEDKPQEETQTTQPFEARLRDDQETEPNLEDEVILPGYKEEPLETASEQPELSPFEAASPAQNEEISLVGYQAEPDEAAVEAQTLASVEKTDYEAPAVEAEAETAMASPVEETSFEPVSAREPEAEVPQYFEAAEAATPGQAELERADELSSDRSERAEFGEGEAITTPASQPEPEAEELFTPAVAVPLSQVRPEAAEPEEFEGATVVPDDTRPQPHAFHQRDERGNRLEAAQQVEPHAFHQRDERGVLAGKAELETAEAAGTQPREEVGEIQPGEFHVFHRRDERGPVPEAIARSVVGQVGGEEALAAGAAIQAETDFDTFEAAANPNFSRTNAPEVELNPVPGIESSDKENEAMPIKRGGKDDDNNVFDWEREELPDYLRDFAIDEDEVARAPRPVNPPISHEADMTTGPTRIRSREPEPPAPNDLPDWLNPSSNRPPAQMNLPTTDQHNLGGGRPNAGGGSLPGWLDATKEGGNSGRGRETGPIPGPMNDMDDLQPFSFDDGDGFGGPSLQPPAIPGTPAPRPQAPQPPRPAQNQPPAPSFGLDDLDIQPFSLDGVDGGFAPPPMQRQSPPGQPPTRQQPPQAQPQSFQPPVQPFGLNDDLDIQPFSLDGMDGGGFAPPPPAQRPPTPQPPQQRPAPAPQQPPSFGLDDLDIQPFSLDGMDGGFAPPAAPSRPAPTPPSSHPAPTPPQPTQPFSLDDMDIQPFNPLNFNDAPTVPTPTQPQAPRQQPPPPPAPQKFPQTNPNMPFGIPGGFEDDLGDLQPFSLDDASGVPAPPPARPAPTPPQARPTPPQPSPAAQPFSFGGGFDDDLPAPFDPFEITGEKPATPPPPQPGSFNPMPMGGEGFVQAQPGSLFGNKNNPPPAPPSRNNQPNAGNLFPTDLDDADLQPFNIGADIPGLGGNEPSSFRANPDDLPSNPLYHQPRPRSRQPEPEFEVEPGMEKPLRNYGWLNRNKREEEEEKPGGSLFEKLAARRKQQGPPSGPGPALPDDLGPIEPDPFADYVSFEEIEQQAAQPATPTPPTPIEQPTFQPFNFELEQAAAQPPEPEVQPFSFDLGQTATPAQPPEPEVQPFSFEFNGAPARPTPPQEPAVQPFSFELGETAQAPEAAVQPFSFDLGDTAAPAQPEETVQPFSFDLGEAEVAPQEPQVQPFSFEFNGPEAATSQPPEPTTQPFSFDLGDTAQPQEPEVQPFSFDLGEAEVAPQSLHTGEPALPDFDLEAADSAPMPPVPPPPPPSNFFGMEDDLTEFDAPQRKPQIEPFGFDLSELAAVPPPPPPPTPPRSLSETQVPPPPPLPIQEPNRRPEVAPPPAFQAEAVQPTIAVNGNGASHDLTSYQSRVRQNPKDLEANLQLGNAYVEQNRVTEALSHYSNAIKVADPETLKTIVAKLQKITGESEANPRYHRVLGDAYMKQGQYHWALSEYSKALGTAAKR